MSEPLSLHISKDEYKAVAIGKTVAVAPTGNLIARLNEWMVNRSALKTKEKVTFFRLMATMINAGVSLIKALNILQEQTNSPKMKRICQKIAAKIEMGQTLSDGLLEDPNTSKGSEIGMIRSGEASGRLNQVLLTLADETEKSAKIKSKIKGAMMYPMAIIFVIIGVFVSVTVLVIPKMKSTFAEAGADLPNSTKVMIAMSDFFIGATFGIPNAIFIICALAGLFAIFKFWHKTENGKLYWDAFLLKLPVFGMLRRKLILSQFARNISTLIKSGISIVKTLQITAE